MKRERAVEATAVKPAGIPASPPPEVLRAMDEAARTLAELQARKISLHFEVDDATNRVKVTVRDGEGNVIRHVPASDLGSLLEGGRSGLVVDAHG